MRLDAVSMETIQATAKKFLTHYVGVITTPTPDQVKLDGVKVERVSQ